MKQNEISKPKPRETMTRSLFSNEDSIDKIVEYIESSEKEVNTKRKKKRGHRELVPNRQRNQRHWTSTR